MNRMIVGVSIISFLIVALSVAVYSALGRIENHVDRLSARRQRAWLETVSHYHQEVDSFGYRRRDPQWDVLAKSRKVFLVGDVVQSATERVMRQLAYLEAQDSTAPITLYITTVGGYKQCGYALAEYMQTLTPKVHTIALGECSSAGAMILAAGTGERCATEYGRIKIHVMADRDDIGTPKGNFDRGILERFWKCYASLPKEWFPMNTAEIYRLDAEEAEAYHIIDKVILPVNRPNTPTPPNDKDSKAHPTTTDADPKERGE